MVETRTLHRDDADIVYDVPGARSRGAVPSPLRGVLRPARTRPGDVRDTSRDDPLLSRRSLAVSDYRLDVEAVTSARTRVVVAVGEESGNTYTARTAIATAEALGQRATVFPSHHGGFLDGEFGQLGAPDEFAARLRDVLDAGCVAGDGHPAGDAHP